MPRGPDRRGEFQDGVGKAIAYAKALSCDRYYRGRIGLEYKPLTTTEASLGWLARWR